MFHRSGCDFQTAARRTVWFRQLPRWSNAAGTIVGWYYTDGSQVGTNAFAVRKGKAVALQGYGRATGINAAGYIVGSATIGKTVSYAVYWAPGSTTPQALPGSVPPGFTAIASAVNDRGVVAGILDGNGDRDPGISVNGAWHLLATGYFAGVTAINNNNVVVGDIGNGLFDNAFVWNGTLHILPLLPNMSVCGASGVNDVGDVVGTCNSGGEYSVSEAFLYHAGTMYDLASLIVSGPTNVGEASGINDAGQISISGSTASQPNGNIYLLNPLPSPSAAVRR